jgi:DNA-binding CsgD family transcriptional regulator/tetratricopeptide (TPR) repeat protein
VRQLIDGRLAWIDAGARRMLQVASVIGADFSLDLWQSVLDAGDDELAAAIEQAQTAYLVTESAASDGLRFQHALIREALYESLVLPHRQRWHRRVAEILAQSPHPDPDAVAHHFQRADDERAARWLIDAGNRAARMYATLTAVERFERAWQLLEHGLDAQVDRGMLLCDLAEAHRYTDAAKALHYLDVAGRVVERSGDDVLATVVLWCRARIRGFIGEDSLDEGRQAVAALERLSPTKLDELLSQGRHIVSRGSISNWFAHFGRYDEAIATAERVLSGTSLNDETSPEHANEMGNAIYALALSYAGLGRPEESRQLFRRAHRCLQSVDNHFMIAALQKWELVEVNLAYATDDTAERARLVEDYVQSWSRTSSFAIEVDGRSILPLFQLDILEGEWDRAHEAATMHLDVSALRVDALATLAEIDWRRGGRASAWVHVRAALPDGAATPPSNLYYIRTLSLLRIAARLAMDDGQFECAREWMDAHERWLAWSGRVLDRAADPLLWAHYHRMRGDRDRAYEHSLESLRLSSEPRQPLALLRAHRLLGELDIEAGRLAEAADHLKRALSLADACALPYERALVELAQAQLEMAHGNRNGVAEMLGRVRQVCESVGAAPVLAHVERLEASRHETPRASRHPSGLSPREVDVLRLVARGMTDVEVARNLRISPRTVSGHLQSIYNKLGISTRTAAAIIAMEHGISEPAAE